MKSAVINLPHPVFRMGMSKTRTSETPEIMSIHYSAIANGRAAVKAVIADGPITENYTKA
jgi:hypothetical protein